MLMVLYTDMEISEERLAQLEARMEQTYLSTEKTRKYILSMLIITVVTIVLPLIAAIFIVPMALNSLLGAYSI